MRQLKITQQTTSRDELSMQLYLSDLNHISQVDIDEEIELARRIQAGGEDGEKAKRRLVEANLRFVVSVAKQYQTPDTPLGDLINEGNIGLIKAAERFDDKRGFKFISYAVWWIRQSIMQALCEYGRTIRIPLNNVAMLSKYRKMSEEFQQEFQREPTVEEFADAYGIEREKVAHVLNTNRRVGSIDAPLSDDEAKTTADVLPSATTTDGKLEHESLQMDLLAVLRRILKEREIAILCEAFGINGPIRSIDEISDRMGMSRERVRQIREQSLAKIRDCQWSGLLRQYL